MGSTETEHVLVARHLPASLSLATTRKIFAHFGAQGVERWGFFLRTLFVARNKIRLERVGDPVLAHQHSASLDLVQRHRICAYYIPSRAV